MSNFFCFIGAAVAHEIECACTGFMNHKNSEEKDMLEANISVQILLMSSKNKNLDFVIE